MTPEQVTALIVALTGLVVAVGTTYQQVRSLRRDVKAQHLAVDGRMSELLVLSQLAAKRQGELEGRDYTARTQPTA